MSAPEEPPGPERYGTEEFAFVDEDATGEVSGWLSFMNSRAGRRADRRELIRERLILLGVALALASLVGGLLLWRPWSSDSVADTGNDALGADRVAVLMQVQGADGAAVTSAILVHDRRGGGRGALVTVPPELVLPVEGEGRLTVRSALAEAGPTLTREAVGELLGVELAGSWVLDGVEFGLLVDRLGGVRVGSETLAGPAALGRVGAADGGREVLTALAAAFPPAFTTGRDLLLDFGVLAAPGVPVERLAAVLTGLSRDGPAGRLGVAVLPLDGSGNGLDVAAALPVVRDLLGGEPGQGREDATPRILVEIGPGIRESDVRADILNAGFEYVAGGAAKGTVSAVLVRASIPDAQALGESIATTLGLPLSAVRLSDDVPFTADVLVVLANKRTS